VHHDLNALSSNQFEQLCFRLIRLEFSNAIKPSDVRDGGADALLPEAGGGYARAWQSKHFPGRINWDQCKESFEAAQKNFGMEHYTFCFPRNLTDRERQTFDRHFRQVDNPVKVDFWNGEELQIRLTDSPEGQRVAKAFFADPQADMEAIARAAEAGGRLSTPEDALDRLRPIGGFLASADPFFSYSAVVYETEQPGPPPSDEAVMSVVQSDDGLTQRIDVAPRDDEAMEFYGPELQLLFPDTKDGRKARQDFLDALKEGRPTHLDEVTVNFTRLPPGMKSSEGRPMKGQVEIGPSRGERPRPPAPWKAHMIARTDKGSDEVNVDLVPAADPPEGWEGMIEGGFGGMRVEMLFRRTQRGGEMTLNYVHKLDQSPIHDQLRALRFLNALIGDGELVVQDRKGGRDDLVLKTQPQAESDQARAIFALLENLAAIENWTGEQFTIPSEVSAEKAQGIARVAAMIRREGTPVSSVEVSLLEDGLIRMRQGGEVGISQDLGARVLGREIHLGKTWLQLRSYKLTELGPDPQHADSTLVRLEPSDGADDFFQALHKPEVSKRPPPPPRRARKRKRGKRKRR